MAATNQNAEVYQGESKTLEISTTDEKTGDARDMTGENVYYRVAPSANASAALEIEPADITIATSVVKVPLTTARTLTLKAREYYHELYMVESGDQRHVLMTGTLTVTAAQVAKHS